jgi:hypothetical protein
MLHLEAGDRETCALPAIDVAVRVLVKDSDGIWQNLSTMGGSDWVVGVRWGGDIDAPVLSGSVMLFRGAGTQSLAPLLAGSELNRNAANIYAPLLDVGRQLMIQTATTPRGIAPTEADYRTPFLGKIDDIDWGKSPITMSVRDLGAVLLDTQMEEERQYGSDSGMLVETVMQQILDDNLGSGAVVLYTPVSPGEALPIGTIDRVSVMEALTTLAAQIGWVVRYKQDATGAWRLTFFSPDRAKTDPDATIPPSEYLDISSLVIADADVRNVIRVRFVNGATQAEDSVLVSDSGSIAEFGRLYAEISSIHLQTRAEALVMATAALTDLAEPKATQVVSMLYFWPTELSDLYGWPANAVHYDDDQTFAVVSFQHELTPASKRTTLTVRGSVAGAYKSWLMLRGGLFTGQPSTGPFPLVGPLGGEASAFGGGPNREGMAWLALKFSKDTDHVDIYATKAPASPVPTPLLAENQKAWTIVRGDGDTASADEWATWIPIATTTAWYRKVVVLPYAADGTRGPTIILETQCVDSDVGPAAAPSGLLVSSAGNSNNISFTINDAAASHLITRNGIVLVEILPGQPGAFTDSNIDPSVPYTYDVFAFRNFQSSAFASDGTGTTTTPTSGAPTAPTWDSGYPKGVTAAGGVATCDFKWHCDASATEIDIELGVALPGSIKWYPIASFTDGAHIPAGEYVDSSQTLFNTLLARLKQTLPDGSVQYSASVKAQWGDPPFTAPTLIFAGVSGGGVTYIWAEPDSRCTQLDVMLASPPLSSSTVWTSVASTTAPLVIASGQTVRSMSDVGKIAQIIATFPGGVKVGSNIVTVQT